MDERLVVKLAGVAGVAREHLAGVALAREQLEGITTFVLGQRQVEEGGRTRRRRERRPEAKLANTRVNRTAGKTSST